MISSHGTPIVGVSLTPLPFFFFFLPFSATFPFSFAVFFCFFPPPPPLMLGDLSLFSLFLERSPFLWTVWKLQRLKVSLRGLLFPPFFLNRTSDAHFIRDHISLIFPFFSCNHALPPPSFGTRHVPFNECAPFPPPPPLFFGSGVFMLVEGAQVATCRLRVSFLPGQVGIFFSPFFFFVFLIHYFAPQVFPWVVLWD